MKLSQMLFDNMKNVVLEMHHQVPRSRYCSSKHSVSISSGKIVFEWLAFDPG